MNKLAYTGRRGIDDMLLGLSCPAAITEPRPRWRPLQAFTNQTFSANLVSAPSGYTFYQTTSFITGLHVGNISSRSVFPDQNRRV